MKTGTILIVAGLIGYLSHNIQAQKTSDLFMPKEIKHAYEKGNRSEKGIPGPNYFINKANYKIKAEFDPTTRLLKGEETIEYINNSRDTLKGLYFNLYQDLYKKGNRRDWDIGTVDLTEGVQIEKIVVDGSEIDPGSDQVRNSTSILRIKPEKAILPGSKTIITIGWHFTLPGTVSIRMGTYNGDNYFIAFWFPKICVYDDISGWNSNGHSGNAEFYNDFGDYDVEITVPGDYTVWSTGLLQNRQDIYTQEILNRIDSSGKSDQVIRIITPEDRKTGNIMKKAEQRVWKFKSEQTPDFAFALSKTYLWDACSYQSGTRRISVNAVYHPDSKDFPEVAEISRNSIQFFSEEIPGLPFPYPQMTAFNGDGGMEFPGMVNDGDGEDRNGTLFVTSHEIGHSYFPFYTGLNEQKYAWMDEGLISFFPQFVIKNYTEVEDYVFFSQNILSYNRGAGTFYDLPLMTASDNINGYAYRFNAYSRSAISFYLLYKYLGEEKFTAGLQLFTERWNGKHPTPYDFFYTYNEISGEDLAWFWKPWFFDFGYADLKIGEIQKKGDKTCIVTIVNKTGFPVPIQLNAEYSDGPSRDYTFPMNVWTKGNRSFEIAIPLKSLVKLTLDSKLTPDAYGDDNIKKL